jgi:hypothetical protein
MSDYTTVAYCRIVLCCVIHVCVYVCLYCSGSTAKVASELRGRFFVETAWGRSFEFQCKSIGEAREWVAVFTEAMVYWQVPALITSPALYMFTRVYTYFRPC